MRRSLAIMLSVIFIGIPLGGSQTVPRAQAQVTTRLTRYAPDEILVKFKEGAPLSARQRARDRIGAKVLGDYSRLATGMQLQRLPAGMSVERAISILQADPDVQYAEPNYVK